MKNIFIPTLVIGFITLLGLTSCKKDYTCICNISATTLGSTGGGTSKTIIHETKSKAKTICESSNSSVNMSGYSTSANCKLE